MDESHLPKSKLLIIIAWIICLIATLNYSFDFFIRAAPGVMAEDLKNAFNIGYAKIGWLSSAYFISYTIIQIPAGVILDKYNRKVVISIATALCVLGNYLFSATNHYEVAFISFCLGKIYDKRKQFFRQANGEKGCKQFESFHLMSYLGLVKK